ncbi:MAG: glycosyltransferase family 1 protein, partial [Patescibacteria group bacterium]
IIEESVAGVRKPYFLHVGTIKERKNILTAVKAFSLFREGGKNDFNLVIVGKVNPESPYVKKLFELVEELGLKDSVIFTGHITDGQMSNIYHHARALLFPSLLEGFGFPVLEAMNCGLPVITSDRGSLAEISHGAAILVDPLNAGELAAAMKKIIEDQELRMNLVVKGRGRAEQFSWTKTARELEQLIFRDSIIG